MRVFPNLIHRFDTDPRWQFRFHAFFTVLWGITMVVLPFFRVLWVAWPALVIEEVSLWANFATHLGAMSSALAGILTMKQVQSQAQYTKLPDHIQL